jgi:acid phosphatase (class A)
MNRGREFLESRLICDVQWKSDVDAGREVGAATVAQLRKNEAFRQDLKTAQIESGSARGRPLGCQVESAALASASR